MAYIKQNNPTPRDIDGTTALKQVGQFVTIQTAGVRELFEQLDKLAGSIAADAFLKQAVRKASKIIKDGYKDEARKHTATGNLAESVTTFARVYKNSNGSKAALDVVGPRQTGATGSQKGKESGNGAWLAEFGSGPRRPGTEGNCQRQNAENPGQGRRTNETACFVGDDQAVHRMSSLNGRRDAGGEPPPWPAEC